MLHSDKMPPFQNRRKSDSNLKEIISHVSDIRGDIKVLVSRSSDTVEELKKNRESHKELYSRTEDNKNNISTLKTKQSITQWIGGVIGMGIVGTIIKWVYSVFHNKLPH